MKFPTLALAVGMAAGILGGGSIATHFPHPVILCLASSLTFLALGFVLLHWQRVAFAAVAAVLLWFSLGALAAQLEPFAIPANRVDQLVAAGRLDLGAPLRWQGTLRSDPLSLPWGVHYDIDLQQLQYAGAWTPVTGGMRIEYYFDERKQQNPVPLRAGDHVEALVRSRLPRNFGDPGAFDYQAFLAGQNIDVTAILRSAALIEAIPGSPPNLSQRVARVRGRLLRQVDDMLAGSPDSAAVARAMLLGDRSFLDRQQAERFQETGVYHVLVLAGLHVGVLAAVLMWVRRKAGFSLLLGTLLTLAILGSYVILVEDRPPILRAALMAAVFLLGRLLFRHMDLLNAVGIAALILLVWRPSTLRDASFLLSFAAAGAIAGIAVPLSQRSAERYRVALEHLSDATRDGAYPPRVTQFRMDARALAQWLSGRMPSSFARLAPSMVIVPCRVTLRLWELLVLTIAIQIAILPLMAMYFHRVALVGLAANIPAVLLTSIIVPLGFLSLGISLIWSGMGHAFGHILAATVRGLVASVDWFANAPWASYRVPSPPLSLLLLFFVALVFCSVAILASWRRATWAASGITLTLAAIIVASPFPARLYPGQLEVTVLDVGQGDSIFVAFPDGRTMLVDGGGLPGSFYVRGVRPGLDVGEDVVSPFLWSRGLKRIDVVALTHAHEDHLGGLAAVLRNFRVGQLWVGRDVESSEYRDLLAQARERAVPVVHRVKGDAFDWGGVQGRVLWPADNDTVGSPSNDDSLVLRLQDAGQALLLTGDIESPVENALTRGDEAALGALFLKVPHHGSRTSSTQGFLDAVHPQYAAISVGEANAFGQPGSEVIARIEAEGAHLYRTDRDGAITTLSDGHNLQITTYLDPHERPRELPGARNH